SFSCARFLRHLPRTRASVGNHSFKARAKTRRHQKHSATWAALAFDGPLLLFTRFYFLFHLNLPLFNPCYFDEATSPGVTMTVSHTPLAGVMPLGIMPLGVMPPGIMPHTETEHRFRLLRRPAVQKADP